MRSLSLALRLVLSAAVIGAILVAPAAAKKPPKPKPPPPPPPAPAANFDTYIRNYAPVIDGVKCDVTPQAVVTTADGGSAALTLSNQPSSAASESCAGVGWLVKFDSFGNPQWQEMVGCFNLPGGSYSYGVSLQQTADGGYVIGGGTIGCGSDTVCPFLSGIQCGLVERLDASGRLLWARVYSSGAARTSINQIRQTSDGGFVAAGTEVNSSANTGAVNALVLKLDGQGNVQWRTRLGQPGERLSALLNAVRQTPDGGYVAAGEFNAPTQCQFPHGCGQGVLVVKLDASGGVVWQRGFNSFDSSGNPTASEHALSMTTTTDGGFLVAGNWGNVSAVSECCRGALLLKLDANGLIQWQKALSGGVRCHAGIGKTTCTAIGADVYSVHQTSDGGFALAGAGGGGGVPMVPWLARTDANGNLLWQHFYYQSQPTQWFASSDLTAGGGHVAVGFTHNGTSGELFAVKTDSAGLVGTCSQVQPASDLQPLDPGLATIAPALPVQTTLPAQDNSPSSTRPTSISSTPGQC
jgi:hypothetical protein